jgi:predicted flap endonuclease-1-like 5' DNA nuclease
MGLLDKLKSVLGLGGSRDRAGRSRPPSGGERPAGQDEAGVTVEREPSTRSEDAVKGTETATAASGASDAERASTGTEGDQAGGAAGETTPAETGPATGTASGATDNAGPAGDAAEPAGEGTGAASAASEDTSAAADASPEGAADDAAAGDTAPVTDVDGIGSAYGERLEGAGIETVGDLADADADDLSDRIDVSAKRIGRWIDQARDR